jgi:CRP-like cAMP-binding protein
MSETIKPKNHLLAALPVKEYTRLLPKLEEVSLTFAETIFEPGDVIRHVYFLNSGVVSLFKDVAEGGILEVGVVGNEGVVGLPVFLGVKTSNNQVIVQGDGTAVRIKTADFLEECGQNGSLPKLLQRYTHSLLTEVSQTVACTRFHLIRDRLICLLLMMHDRMKTDTFKMTQEILSKMLGVRREAVNKSATSLQQNGLISYYRGKVSILNRAGLEAAACGCYFIIKEETSSSNC